jgi:cytochrome c oxidase subunit 3
MSSHAVDAHTGHHRDDEGAKLGMWLFIFTELLIFGGLFLVYSVYRFKNPEAFQIAGEQLNTTIGLINTIILLVSSMTIAMAITAIQRSQKQRSMWLMAVTIILALVFMVNKYFEWSAKIHHGLYPGSEHLKELGAGQLLFFGLYFLMTGLHALHIIIGVIFIGFVMKFTANNEVNSTDFVYLENAGLYWHLVDLIWIYLFPLFYLIH